MTEKDKTFRSRKKGKFINKFQANGNVKQNDRFCFERNNNTQNI